MAAFWLKDFSQKVLSMKFRESQNESFGKKGMSLYTAKQSGNIRKRVYYSSVHCYDQEQLTLYCQLQLVQINSKKIIPTSETFMQNLTTALDSQKNLNWHYCANLTSQRPTKSSQPSDFFQVGKCLTEGSERSTKQKFHAKKLALFNIRLITHEHLHMHLNKLRCIVDHVPQLYKLRCRNMQ